MPVAGLPIDTDQLKDEATPLLMLVALLRASFFLFWALYQSLTYYVVGVLQRATDALEQMKQQGVQPNLLTYTTLIHGWASASYPEKALACYDDMKATGLRPDITVS
jgi:pentatricopeptide repeat protein